MDVTVVSENDDLVALVAQINGARWDDANDMAVFSAPALRAYLQRADTLFIVCHQQAGGDGPLLGLASGRIQMKPYDHELWLYVDELDVCVDQRRRGVGKRMMQTLLRIAADNGCSELWLGTEVDNHPANALYRSLDPNEVDDVVGYAYETG